MFLLVVDDNQHIRARVVEATQAIPGVATVTEATSATEALTAMAGIMPDLVLLDLALGAGPTGFDVLNELRKWPRAPRVIVLSNHADEVFRRRALAMGAMSVFDKSTQFAAALGAVAALARNFGHTAAGGGHPSDAAKGVEP